MNSTTKRALLIAAIAIVVWQGYPYLFGSNNAKPQNTVRVSVSEAMTKDIPINLSLVGSVVAYESVAVKSRIDSQVVEVPFKDGDTVAEGQLLFALDDRTLAAQKKEFEAALQKEKAQLTNAKLQYDRAVQLLKSKTVSQSRVDDARAAYVAQEAQVRAAQASLDSVGVMLSFTQIKAPIGGRAGTINVTRGNTVKANDALALVTINQTSPIRAHFAVPERYYDQVKKAMSAGSLQVTALRSETGETTSGTLEYVDNAINTSNGTFAARGVFANDDEKLWPGMFVKITMDLGKIEAALTVPATAIQGDDGARFVFILDAEGKKALRKEIILSQITDDLAIIESGISAGDKIITDGLLRVNDGSAVEVKPVTSEQPVKPAP